MTGTPASAAVAGDSPKPGAELPVGNQNVRVARLADLKAVRGELGRLYREARRREGRFPDALTAQRLSNVLGHVRTMIELELFEKRLASIEERLNARA